MSRKEQADRLVQLLQDCPQGLGLDILKSRLSIGSVSTFYRVLDGARNIPGVVINSRKRLYILDNPPDHIPDPKILSDADLETLVTLQHILDKMTPGILRSEFEPLRNRLEKHLENINDKCARWTDRIKILDIHYRRIEEGIFGTLLKAVTRKHAINFQYTDSRGKTSERVVSPQQLVRYKDNWYLDGWCHLNQELRIFSLDCIAGIRRANRRFHPVPQEQLKRIYATSYGIFSGEPAATAIILFTGIAARYAMRESWHPDQRLTVREENVVELHIPYNKPQELLKEVLSWGPLAEILAPAHLRGEIAGMIQKAGEKYASGIHG